MNPSPLTARDLIGLFNCLPDPEKLAFIEALLKAVPPTAAELTCLVKRLPADQRDAFVVQIYEDHFKEGWHGLIDNRIIPAAGRALEKIRAADKRKRDRQPDPERLRRGEMIDGLRQSGKSWGEILKHILQNHRGWVEEYSGTPLPAATRKQVMERIRKWQRDYQNRKGGPGDAQNHQRPG